MSCHVPASSAGEILSNLEHFLKKCRITRESDKDREILTLANLDDGYVRRFIIRKVDENILLSTLRRSSSRKSQKSLKDVNANHPKADGVKSTGGKVYPRSPRPKRELSRRNSTASTRSTSSNKSNRSWAKRASITVRRSLKKVRRSKPKKRLTSSERRRREVNRRFRLAWNASDNEKTSSSDADDDRSDVDTISGLEIEGVLCRSASYDSSVFEEMTAKDRLEKDDPGVVNPAFVRDDDDDEDEGVAGVQGDDMEGRHENNKEDQRRSDGDGTSDVDSMSSEDSSLGMPRFNLKMSPRPSPRHSPQYSPISYRGGYQSHRSSTSSVRKGILKKSSSSTTINMEMANLGQQQEAHDMSGRNHGDENGVAVNVARFIESTEDNISLGAQRSLAGNRVKFILDPGKPDNITGDYGDIKIEKIERERTERIERGKNMDVTNSKKLTKSGKKCLLFCTALIVLTGAVIFGSILSTNRFKQTDKVGAEERKMVNLVEGQFRIINRNFTSELQNPKQQLFKTYASELEKELLVVLSSPVIMADNSTVVLRIIEFMKGSIVATFRLYWSNPTPTAAAHAPTLRKDAEKHLKTTHGFGDFRVDRTSFTLKDIPDLCQPSLSKCSHNCTINTTTLLRDCHCPPGFSLVNDTTCQDQKTASSDSQLKLQAVLFETYSKNATLIAIKKEEQLGGSEKISPSAEEQEAKDEKKHDEQKKDTDQPEEDIKEKTSTHDAKGTESKASGDVVKDTKPPEKSDESAPSEKPKKTDDIPGDQQTSSDHSKGDSDTHTQGIKEESLHDEQQEEGKTQTIKSVLQPDPSELEKETKSVVEMKSDQDAEKSEKTSDKKPDTKEHQGIDKEVIRDPIPINTVTLGEEGETVNEIQKPANTEITHVLPSLPPAETTLLDEDTEVKKDQEKKRMQESESAPTQKESTMTESKQTNHSSSEIGQGEQSLVTKHLKELTKGDDGLREAGSSATDNQTKTHSTDKSDSDMPPVAIESPSVNLTGENVTDVHVVPEFSSDGSNKPTASTVQTVNASFVQNDMNKTVISEESGTVQLTNATASTPKDDGADTLAPEENDPSVKKEPPEKTIVTVQAILLNDVNPVVANKTPPPIRTSTPPGSTDISHSPSGDQPDLESGGRVHSPIESPTAAEEGASDPSTRLDFGLIANVSLDLANLFDDVSKNQSTAAGHHLAVPAPMITESTPPTSLKPKCKTGEFACTNGSSHFGDCVPDFAVCNGVFDCLDRSDEEACTENKCYGNYQCWSGDCLERKYVCDGIAHCGDGGEEKACDTWTCRENEFKCEGPSISPCIPLSLKCDGHADCFNHTDEMGCSQKCPADQFLCPEGWCIPSLWKCDGTADCINGEDELNCDCTGLDNSRCEVGGCVPTFELCDGLRQCLDGSDEWGCLRIDNSSKQLQVRSREERWYAVCGDNWTSEWTELVCEQLGFGVSLSTEVRRVTEAVPRPRVNLSPEASPKAQAPLQYSITHGECSNEPLVHISCSMPECGQWSIVPDLSAAGLSSLDKRTDIQTWPSLAQLFQPFADLTQTNEQAKNVACPASIITPSWVLTAYSCLITKENGLHKEKWALFAGDVSPQAGLRQTQIRYAKRIMAYPGAKKVEGFWTGDFALVKLSGPLDFDETVQPVCMAAGPPKSRALCVVASWREVSVKDKHHKVLTQDIQHLPVPHLTLSACNRTQYGGRLSKWHMCAGFSQHLRSPCMGSEGSPLMCADENGRWFLHGVLSHHGNCATFNHPSVFNTVDRVKDWIKNTIGRPPPPEDPTTTTSTTQTTTTVAEVVSGPSNSSPAAEVSPPVVETAPLIALLESPPSAT